MRNHLWGVHPIVLERLAVYSVKMKTKINTLLSHSTPVRVVRRLTSVFAFFGVIGLLAGCASEPESHTISPPTRSATTTATTSDTMFPAGFENPTNRPITTPSSSSSLVSFTPL
jgi:hypothetical protein